MEQKFIDLFDRYTHGGMNRRDFLERLTGLAGSAAAATALLPLLENNYAHAEMVPENDPAITAEMTEIAPGIKGYLVRPKAAGTYPVVLVIHENRGLNPHIKDVTRRMAKEGFIAFGADYLTPLGGTPADEEKAREMFKELKPEAVVAFSQSAVDALAKIDGGNGKVGAVGFCWGGGAVNALAVTGDLNLKAGVAYYGMQPKAAEVPKITAPLMLHYAGLDERINAGIKDYEAALKADGKVFELFVYDGVNHAFNNDTNAARYNKDAADLAWGRTIGFFRKYLS
ncbi:dienelactone hydrolase family protein [Aestuariivirga litoralis]|uniref:Dienelactone hydrolase family protein n=1 Tax=Aestuariivirga litoralis TaxID=2650924 RepID=A0A2W2BR41_9HYPH|nr:dienelactone hydrolase family protein [Aestuariivirga litoralis]PZF78689.1 dienelactone hydrolase family protein [Aestuariivirga litoralis]